MIQVIYRWEVQPDNQRAFVDAWERTTVAIRDTVVGARGSLCIVSVDRPIEILTVAKWDELDQWQEFVQGAHLSSMKEMHELGGQISREAYVQKKRFHCLVEYLRFT